MFDLRVECELIWGGKFGPNFEVKSISEAFMTKTILFFSGLFLCFSVNAKTESRQTFQDIEARFANSNIQSVVKVSSVDMELKVLNEEGEYKKSPMGGIAQIQLKRLPNLDYYSKKKKTFFNEPKFEAYYLNGVGVCYLKTQNLAIGGDFLDYCLLMPNMSIEDLKAI